MIIACNNSTDVKICPALICIHCIYANGGDPLLGGSPTQVTSKVEFLEPLKKA